MTTNRARAWLLLLACLGLSAAYTLQATAVAGGGIATNQTYQCGLAVAQSAASGVVANGQYDAVIGFWHNPYGGGLPGVSDAGRVAGPPAFSLSGANPNPFRGRTSIHYSLLHACKVRLDVVDVTGRVLGLLVDEQQTQGEYRVAWDVGHVPAGTMPRGVYFCRLRAGEFMATRKIVKQ